MHAEALPARRSFAVATVLVLVVALTVGPFARDAEAFVAAPVGPALVVAPAALGGPVTLAAAAGVVIVGGVFYLGYAAYQTQTREVEWQFENGDPALQEKTTYHRPGYAKLWLDYQTSGSNYRIAMYSQRSSSTDDCSRAYVLRDDGSTAGPYAGGCAPWEDHTNVQVQGLGAWSATPPPMWSITTYQYHENGSTWKTDPDPVISSVSEFSGGESARVRVDTECYNGATDTATTVTDYSAWYADPTAPEPIPAASPCPSGSHVRDVEINRELPGQPDEPLTDPADRPAIIPAPSWVDEFQEDTWNWCNDNPEQCEPRVYDGREDPRRLLVPGVPNWNWWEDPTHKQWAECEWLDLVTGDVVVMPIEQCEPLQYEEHPDLGLVPKLPPYTGTPSTPPATPVKTPTNCFGTIEDPDQGFISWVVFQGAACALQWAFVPSSDFVTDITTQLETSTMSRLPFSWWTVITTHIPQIVPLPGDGGSCVDHLWAFPPANYDHPLAGPQLAIPCSPPWDHTVPLLTMHVFVIIGVIRGVWNMLSRPLGAPGDGLPTGSLGSELSG